MNIQEPKYIYPPLFEDFWKSYPRKKRKTAAFLVWRKLNRTQKMEVVIASKNYAEAVDGKEEEYILYPTTFLNPKKCLWEDHLKPPKKEKTWLEGKMEDNAKDKD